MERLKVGVFGVGSLGRHHARIYAANEAVDLVGVFDLDAARAGEVAHEHGTVSFEDPCDLAARIEAASVVVPTDRHHDVAAELLRRKIHLLVEKPISSTTAQAEAMVRMAQEQGVIMQVGHVERFNPVMDYLEANLTQPRFIEVTRLAPYPPRREGAAPRGTEVSVVLDLMIHDLEIIMHIVRSPVREIHAIGVPVLSPTEDIANVRLVFESGCVANVTASRISRERMRKLRVFQEETYLSLDYMNQTGQLLRKTASGIVAAEVPIEKREPLAAELDAFVQCVLSRRTPVVTGEHASNALKLAVEICRTIRERPG